ncbi:hypothetical protein [Variovorax sp. V118]|uniref:hypothetical protein n=1 Tax=Variovorax sp. V118 TaxID=3065954 RepID=UPI0034E87D7A
MDHVPVHLIPAIATITAAFIAGLVAFLVAVLSKEQKTSEFRQHWIDSLGNDIAELIGEATLLHEVSDRMTGQPLKKTEEQTEARYSNLVKVRTLIARIELRVNPRENAEFLAALNAIRRPAFQRERLLRAKRIDALTSAAQAMLKKEWKRVKTGEPTFRLTKFVAAALFTTALIFGCLGVFLNLQAVAAAPAASIPKAP